MVFFEWFFLVSFTEIFKSSFNSNVPVVLWMSLSKALPARYERSLHQKSHVSVKDLFSKCEPAVYRQLTVDLLRFTIKNL